MGIPRGYRTMEHDTPSEEGREKQKPLGELDRITIEDIENTPGIHRLENHPLPIVEACFVPRDAGMSSDSLTVFNCPLCSEDHQHGLEPEVILGGISRVRSQCDLDWGYSTYYLCLEDFDRSVYNETILWARREMTNEYGEFDGQIIPTGLDPRSVTASTIPGW